MATPSLAPAGLPTITVQASTPQRSSQDFTFEATVMPSTAPPPTASPDEAD